MAQSGIDIALLHDVYVLKAHHLAGRDRVIRKGEMNGLVRLAHAARVRVGRLHVGASVAFPGDVIDHLKRVNHHEPEMAHFRMRVHGPHGQVEVVVV